MPDLPTLTVTVAQADTLLATFTGHNDPVTGEVMTPQRAYRRWLRNQLVAHVTAQRALEIDAAAVEQKRVELEELTASLPPAP